MNEGGKGTVLKVMGGGRDHRLTMLPQRVRDGPLRENDSRTLVEAVRAAAAEIPTGPITSSAGLRATPPPDISPASSSPSTRPPSRT